MNRDSQLLVNAAVVFGILGLLLVYFEESTDFSYSFVIQPILAAVSIIFAIYSLMQLRKKGTAGAENQKQTSSFTSSSSSLKTSEENKPSPGVRTMQRASLVVGIIAQLAFGVAIFFITEGQPNNWIFPMIFVVGALAIVAAGRYARIW